MNNSSRDAEAVYDMMFDKLDHMDILTSLMGIVYAHFEK